MEVDLNASQDAAVAVNNATSQANIILKKAKLEIRPNLVQRKIRDSDSSKEDRTEAKKMKTNQTQADAIQLARKYSGDGNRFKVLSNENPQDIEAANDILRQISMKNLQGNNLNSKPRQNLAVSSDKDKINSNKSASVSIKKEKVPPIIVFKQEVTDSIKILKNVLKIKDFRIKRYSVNRHAILLENKEDFVKTREILKSVATEHYTYCPKGEKVHTVLLKGLDPSSDPDEILSELKSLDIDGLKFILVKRFETRFSKEQKNKLPIFIVQISSDSKVNKVKDVKYVNFQVVRWENIVRKDVLQCRRCQRFGHSASNCQMKYRCVKCANDHEPGQCLVQSGTVQDKTKIFCTLCKNYGHPASYRGCPRYLELKQKLLNKREQTKINSANKVKMYSNFINKNISFANVAANVSDNLGVPSNTQNFSQNSSQNFMGEIRSMLVGIQNQLTSFKIMLEEEKSRIDVLFDLIGSDGMNE